jgi:phospholipase C
MRKTLLFVLSFAGACAQPETASTNGALTCPFPAGALASETLGLSEAARRAIPLRHVVVMMKENRSFDHIFGGLQATRPDVETFPASYANRDAAGELVKPFHLSTTCVPHDPGHQWREMHDQVDHGRMDGFVRSAAGTTRTDGHFALGYYDSRDLPFYYFLADTFALADHYFPSVNSGTYPNRDYLLLGTSDHVHSTGNGWPDTRLPSLFDRLDAAGVSWGVFADDDAFDGALDDPHHNWHARHPVQPVSAIVRAFADDTVPNVVFVDSRSYVEDEHPTADVQVGEAWSRRIYEAAINSPAWPATVLLLTYDEAGGFFDHVPPPDTCLARPSDGDFFERGVRVPLIAISPWARRHYVSKTVKEHTSITRFIEALFGLPALTARDASSDGLLDMFDFSSAPAPIATAPAAGTGGCAPASVH